MSSGPSLSSAQARAVDRICRERFHLPVEWLMEAAGWELARHCPGRTAVLCGTGNNGGDGLAAARHLHRWGRLQTVACIDRTRLQGAAAREADVLERIGVAIEERPRLEGAEVILDSLLGTGISRAPEGDYADWIRAANASGARIVAADLPSGLDADSGRAYDPCIRAQTTVTLGFLKIGLQQGDGPEHAGQIEIADIGIPREALP
ncbi:MAG TPA: NAD(P)H-hydrate epimerase [Candidatus Dormibacteraeota bacterium]